MPLKLSTDKDAWSIAISGRPSSTTTHVGAAYFQPFLRFQVLNSAIQSFFSAWQGFADRTIVSRCRLFTIGNAGAIATITAVAAPALLMIAGFACDYGYSSYINQRLARAADSAAVDAVSQTSATDYAALQSAASTIDLGNTVAYKNSGDTGFHNELAYFLSLLSPAMTQGSGASATSPLNYTFLITDGLNDVVGPCVAITKSAPPL